MRLKNNTLLTFLAFFLSILGLIGPGFWDIKSPNPIKYGNDHLTRATLGLRFNPNDIALDNKFKNSKITSKNYKKCPSLYSLYLLCPRDYKNQERH